MRTTEINLSDGLIKSGQEIDTIDVKISKRIIQLFSEGLYSSPHKAIEELVSNSFDANARNVHVLISANIHDSDATITVIDDGESMDLSGLRSHWVIGQSNRRTKEPKSQRMPIGKFGIGKLATYVLAERLTHICKVDGTFLIATMDYSLIGESQEQNSIEYHGGIFNGQDITIPVRELSENEAKAILEPFTNGSAAGYHALKLFGHNATPSWTVAIMSHLKPMGQKIQIGKLGWILRSAMPLRDDFILYLNGAYIEPLKINTPLIDKWIIGKDILVDTLKDPCPDGFILSEDSSLPNNSPHHYGLLHESLGRITGYVELFEDDISGGKSDDIGRSNGFFVYVRERMINTDDPGFGIDRNLLRHGTFSRFRMVVHIDNLDDALRSSRESLQQGELYNLAKNFLHANFNLARNRLVDFEKAHSPGAFLSTRFSSVPGSLTRQPLIALAEYMLSGRATPQYSRLPEVTDEVEKQRLLDKLKETIYSDTGIIQTTEFVTIDTNEGLAIYDMVNCRLQLNLSHPFIAAYQEVYMKSDSRMPLEVYAMTEILTEAQLYYLGIEEPLIKEILQRRDELLRYIVRSSLKKTAGMISQALIDAKDDESKLEEEMRAAFEAIGFANVIRIGGKGKPDGTAEAHLAATEAGIPQRYKVGLEAKSGGSVSAKRLGVSGIDRHMRDYACDHHLVIGNSFDTNTGEGTASVSEIRTFRENSRLEGRERTITLMYIDDLARLVRLIPVKRIDLVRLRDLFKSCITPEESKVWIDKVSDEKRPSWPYKEILDTIWERANSRDNEPIEYSAVYTAMEYRDPSIKLPKQDLIDCCKAMSILAVGLVYARATTVEITCRPDLVLREIRETIDNYPEEERDNIVL